MKEIEDSLKEKNLEDEIERAMLDNGYIRGTYNDETPVKMVFDKEIAIDKEQLLSFVKESQPKSWRKYSSMYGANSDRNFIKDVVKYIKENGLLDVLKHGINLVSNSHFDLAYFKPEDETNIEAMQRFNSNKFVCARQFHYSMNEGKKSIDVVVLLNGIPIVSVELKNQFTGQSTENAVKQFCKDRDQKEPMFRLNQRCLVFFAIDNYTIQMSTKLEGDKSVFFPFDQGSNGPGKVGGRGNPIIPEDLATSYLYKETLTKDNLMRIIQNYMVYDKKGNKLIFPRYHQRNCVEYLIDESLEHGPGRNYLIEHSAGSGKTNTITWLAYRLLSLHNNGKKVFDTVLVVVHRKVLDEMLRDNMKLFEEVRGTFKEVESSSELRDLLCEHGSFVIASTIQKYAMIKEAIKPFHRNFAIICDEAHDSETGKAVYRMKKSIGEHKFTEDEQAIIDEADEEEAMYKLFESLKYEGIQDNMCFFAFTATPKVKTLNAFGRKDENGQMVPHHIYSMRQALEEGFIVDVLEDIKTYDMFYRLTRSVQDDPLVVPEKAARLLTQFEALHERNVNEKARVIVEYVTNYTARELNGKAKAMVVVESRQMALEYYKAIRKYIKDKGYLNVDALVAFSGSLEDEDDDGNEIKVTESNLNHYKDGKRISSSNIESAFDSPDFNILVAANKFQTGFDQPYLTTMFVDKPLSGVNAVQTLSRLNRIVPGEKKHTHIIDFCNDVEKIQEAFIPYYGETILSEPIDPGVVYQYRNRLENYGVIIKDEVEKFSEMAGDDSDSAETIKKASALLSSARERFLTLSADDRDSFRKLLNTYYNAYNTTSVVIRFMDPYAKVLSVYCHMLWEILPRPDVIEMPDILRCTNLEYYRLVENESQSISLCEGDPLNPPTGDAGSKKVEEEYLSEVIKKLNDKWGTDFQDGDRVVEQVANRVVSSEENISDYAESNLHDFTILMKKKVESDFADVAMENQDFMNRIMNDKEAYNQFIDAIIRRARNIALEKKQS